MTSKIRFKETLLVGLLFLLFGIGSTCSLDINMPSSGVMNVGKLTIYKNVKNSEKIVQTKILEIEAKSDFSKKIVITSYFFKYLTSIVLISCGIICIFLFLYWNHELAKKKD